MTLMDLCPSEKFESKTIEVKSRLDQKDKLSWLKTIDGFANYKGGRFYIGVNDGTFELEGFNNEEVSSYVNSFINDVNNSMYPRIEMDFDYLEYSDNGKQKTVIQVTVFESMHKPVVLTYHGVPSIYIRYEGRTSPAHYEQIEQMALNSSRISYDNQLTKVLYDAKDFTKLFSFYKLQTNNELTDKLLKAIGFIDDKGHLYQGSLLFKDDYDGQDTRIKFSSFPGFTRGSDTILMSQEFKGNLLDGIEAMRAFLNKNQVSSYRKTSSGREEKDSYPYRSVLEAFINALAHRDYSIKDSQIQFYFFPDRLEISSPGSFYYGVHFKHERNLSRIISKRRNLLISEVFIKLRLMEGSATGFEKIQKDYEKQDEAHKPFVDSSPDSFTIVIPNMLFKDGLSPEALGDLNLVIPPHENGSKHDYSILSFCYFNYKSAEEIAKHLNVSPSSYFRNILKSLAELKFLETKEEGKTTTYRTNSSLIVMNDKY